MHNFDILWNSWCIHSTPGWMSLLMLISKLKFLPHNAWSMPLSTTVIARTNYNFYISYRIDLFMFVEDTVKVEQKEIKQEKDDKATRPPPEKKQKLSR